MEFLPIPRAQDRGYMGQFLRALPEVRNIHTFIHGLYKTRYAFAQSATIVQQKRFPDVSFYQGSINWNLMQTKTDTIIIRAGQNNWVDTEFNRNWVAAKVRGMKRGVYWFYDGRRSPIEQADLLVSLIKNDPPEMDIIFDWETNYGGAYEGIRNVVAMMKRVEMLMAGKYVTMYTGYYWFIQNSNPITHAAEYDYLKDKGLHLAWYTSDASLVKIPQPWSSLLLWQFGTPNEGALHGVITPTIDMNFFNGTLAEFAARYGAVTPPPPPTGANMEKWKVIAKVLNVRTGSGTAYPIRTTLITGDVIEGVLDAASGWIHISTRNGAALDGWCSGGSAYVEKIVPPAPVAESIYISHTFTDTLIVEKPDGSTQTYSATWTMPDVEYKPNP